MKAGEIPAVKLSALRSLPSSLYQPGGEAVVDILSHVDPDLDLPEVAAGDCILQAPRHEED